MQALNANIPGTRTTISVTAAALFVIVAFSAPAVWRLALRLLPIQDRRSQALPEIYEDEDGIATQESVAAYSYQLPRILVLLISVVCLANSLVCCVITTQSRDSGWRLEQWMQFGAWVRSDVPQLSGFPLTYILGLLDHSSIGIVYRATVHCAIPIVSIRSFV
jgi:hypothetical protein